MLAATSGGLHGWPPAATTIRSTRSSSNSKPSKTSPSSKANALIAAVPGSARARGCVCFRVAKHYETHLVCAPRGYLIYRTRVNEFTKERQRPPDAQRPFFLKAPNKQKKDGISLDFPSTRCKLFFEAVFPPSKNRFLSSFHRLFQQKNTCKPAKFSFFALNRNTPA